MKTTLPHDCSADHVTARLDGSEKADHPRQRLACAIKACGYGEEAVTRLNDWWRYIGSRINSVRSGEPGPFASPAPTYVNEAVRFAIRAENHDLDIEEIVKYAWAKELAEQRRFYDEISREMLAREVEDGTNHTLTNIFNHGCWTSYV